MKVKADDTEVATLPRLAQEAALGSSPAPTKAKSRSAVHALSWSLSLLVVLGVSASVLWYFHDKFWCAADEGTYAHVAERLLHGEVLGRDVQSTFGYINFTNAAAFSLFGLDLVSLRYPLVLAGVLQALLLFLYFGRERTAVRIVAPITASALGVVQFLNPTAHWYCGMLVVATACSLAILPRTSSRRIVLAAFLVTTLGMYRELSGIFSAMGLVSFLLLENRDEVRGRQVVAARALVAFMGAGLIFYLTSTFDLVGFLLFGLFPVMLLCWLFATVAVDSRTTGRIVALLLLGGLAASVPLLVYHLVHGSLGVWSTDLLLLARGISGFATVNKSYFGYMLGVSVFQIVDMESPREVLNGIFWMALLLASVTNGILVARRLWRERARPGALDPRLAFPVLALFYGMVTLISPIPIYVFFSAGLSIAAAMWFAEETSRAVRYGVVALGLTLSAVGLWYHAAQPLSRGVDGTLKGQRVAVAPSSLDRCGLWIESTDDRRYSSLVAFIHAEVPEGEPIFVLPYNPELYFLSDRPNPFRFYNSAFGMRTEEEYSVAVETLERRAPRLVLFNPNDKYATPYAARLAEIVRARYDAVGTIESFQIYRSRASQPLSDTLTASGPPE